MDHSDARVDRQDDLEATVVELKAEVTRLRADLDRALGALGAPTDHPSEGPAAVASAPAEAPVVNRRAALRRGGALAATAVAGGAAIVALTAEPAAAATITGSGNPGGDFSSTTGHAVEALTTANAKAGYYTNTTQTGVLGVWSSVGNATSVYATNSSASGTVTGLNAGAGPGLYGTSANGHGVQTFSQSNSLSGNDYGVRLISDNVNLRLPAVTQNPASSTFDFLPGDIFHYGDDVWLCIVGGNSPRYRKLGGTATAGALHVLSTPQRAYDSRPGTSPAQGPKTPLVAGTSRTIDLTAAGVPDGSTAVLLTILLVNATAGSGNFTVWANGLATPASNTMVWGGDAGRFTATAVSGVDTLGRVKVVASLGTNVVIDVVGYYH